MTKNKLASILLGAAAMMSCGDNARPGFACGDGTTEVEGVCVADGSTCGPGTVEAGGSCVLDTAAPGPVSGLAASVAGNAVSLSWAAGENAAGTVIARLDAGGADAPALNTLYAAGGTLPAGAKVIFSGSGTSATDTVTEPGRYVYVAWAHNASARYAFGREATAVVGAFGAQATTIAIDVAAGTATVTSQPAAATLAISNYNYDAGGQTVSFDLSYTNTSGGQIFSPKLVINEITAGDVQETGTLGGEDFVTLGFAGVLPDEPRSNFVSISGLGATDTSTITATIKESSFGIVGGDGIDLDGGPSMEIDFPEIQGRSNSTTMTTGVFGSSGRYYYGLSRWSSSVFRVDTSNGHVTGIGTVASGSASGECIVWGDDGFAYALFQLGSHHNSNGNGMGIAKLDLGSMTTLATATMYFNNEENVRGCDINGATFATSYGNEVYLFDLAAWQFIDVDTDNDGIQGISTNEDVFSVVFSPDASSIYAADNRGGDITEIDTTTYETSLLHTSTTSRIYDLTVTADGTLWWGAEEGLFSYAGGTESSVPNGPTEVEGISRIQDGHAWILTENATMVVNLTDGSTDAIGSLQNDDHTGHKPTAYFVD